MAEKYTLELQKRPWYTWLAWALWFAVEIFVFQNAISSRGELEPLASTIFWVTFFVLLIAGLAIYFLRRDAK